MDNVEAENPITFLCFLSPNPLWWIYVMWLFWYHYHCSTFVLQMALINLSVNQIYILFLCVQFNSEEDLLLWLRYITPFFVCRLWYTNNKKLLCDLILLKSLTPYYPTSILYLPCDMNTVLLRDTFELL